MSQINPSVTDAQTGAQRARTSGEVIAQFKGQTLYYQDRPVVRDLNFSIHAGERVALVGHSGAGKSTVLRALRQQMQSECAWCPQDAGLVPMLSVYHNIYMGALHRHGVFYNLANLVRPWREPWQQVRKLSVELGLEHLLSQAVEQLSGGQQQRTAVARAVFQRQPIFLGDEPVSALDAFQAQQVLEFICKRHDSLVLSLHDTGQALRFCDRIIGLVEGKVVLDTPALDINQSDLQALYQ
ncbi:ATP-binding cassette domain-containing protein [Pseudomaricurvus alkylphenolicus]|uniref:ATP-binding cassette domain-containing protein n=1 Tax=Pseudomaricurvus alkylphenolicus TaxID=1306991 RepID=UPI0030B88BD8